MPFQPKFKARLLAALRSGKFRQTQGFLRLYTDKPHGSAYCCLGVAMTLKKAEWVSRTRQSRPSCRVGGRTIPGNAGKVKLSGVFPGVTGDELDKLIKMNDSGSSFSDIADTIEKEM